MKISKRLGLCSILVSSTAMGAQTHIKGVVDVRASFVDSVTSYAAGGYGKLGLDDGNQLSLAQAALELGIEWDNNVSLHVIGNSYANEFEQNLGLTEAYLKYRSLPSENGYRWQNRTGIFYPKISLENNAIGWASINTLNSSTINTWIGEEVRVLGSEFSITRLGKFNNSVYDTTVSLTAFTNNDPTGALLAWHGWTIGNQQTLWTESREIAPFLAHQPGGDIAGQAQKSDPFKEIDNRIGYHLNVEIKRAKKGRIAAGFYNNRGRPYIVENGQYAWQTRFAHVGGVWNFDKTLQLSAQALYGDTLMQHPTRRDAVNNDYHSAYIALSKRMAKHRLTTRIESFGIKDNDLTVGDNNDEHGVALTLSYQYRLTKGWFLGAEYNGIDSYRPSRWYANQPRKLKEHQLQFSARYFFAK
ncbi:MAG: hypothetical protein ACPG8A_04505 [Psychrobium sp.]